jgi:hypothetical protein
MNALSWLAIVSLVAMVYSMLKFHVDPMIILALLVCCSLLAIAAMFVADSAKDRGSADIAELKISTAEMRNEIKKHEQRISDLESV